jgi:hypothetical protein
MTGLSPAGRRRIAQAANLAKAAKGRIATSKPIDLPALETSDMDRGSIDSVNKFGKRIDCAASGRKYHHCSPPPGHLSTQVKSPACGARP